MDQMGCCMGGKFLLNCSISFGVDISIDDYVMVLTGAIEERQSTEGP